MATNKKSVSDSDTKSTAAEAESTIVHAEDALAAPTKMRYDGVVNFAYIGPSLPGGKLKSNTILSGTYAEITAYYNEAITLYPNAARLIVPVARLAEFREKVRTSGNVMYNYYAELAAAISAKGEE